MLCHFSSTGGMRTAKKGGHEEMQQHSSQPPLIEELVR